MPGFDEIVEAMKKGEWIPPIAKLIGMELLKAEGGEAEFTMIASDKHHNPMGTLHGGVMVDIMDAAMGMAFASSLNKGELFTTINLQINYMKQVIEGRLTATASIIKRGRSVGFLESELRDEQGDLVATAQSTCKVLKEKS